MPAKLSQVVAIEKSTKSRVYAEVTEIHKALQRTEPLKGIARAYTPKNDGDDVFPSESTPVQLRAERLMEQAQTAWVAMFDTVAQKEWANQGATADVIVDGYKLLENVPVCYLLFLEKQASDLRAFVAKLPVLDPAESWEYSDNQDCWQTKPKQTTKTKKIRKPVVKYEATKEHPAQVEMMDEDIVQGTWSTTHYSGALPAARVSDMLRKVERLQDALKMARESANDRPAPEKLAGRAILDFVFRR